MKYLVLIPLILVFTTEAYSQEPIIRITHDDLKRDYKILFSAGQVYDVRVNLLSSTHDILMTEEFSEKAFLKIYSLDKLSEGMYTWQVKYGEEEFRQDFRIKSERRLLKESITVMKNDLNLDIHVKDYNRQPMNIFIFNIYGDQMDYVFWDPENEESNKQIDLSLYDAYEIKLEIVQGGDLAFEEEFLLY